MTTPLGITIHMSESEKNVKLLGAECQVELDADECPAHGKWTAKVSRRGTAFWGCNVPQGEDYCFMRPSYQWRQKHDARAAIMMSEQNAPQQAPQPQPAPNTPPQPSAPPAPSSAPTESAADFDDLPF